jgi:hypothetical protein
MLRFVRENYFLVGVTEYLNEFLVLIAVHMGWEPADLYYIYCKATDLNIHAHEFQLEFPELYDELKQGTQQAQVVYESVRSEFTVMLSEVKRDFPQFDDLVAEFNRGLKVYQRAHVTPHESIYHWKPYQYVDRKEEYC